MLVEGFEGRRIKGSDVLAVALRVALKEVVGKEIDVFAPFAKRRQVNLDGIQPEEKVLTKAAGSGLCVDVGVGRGQNSHVHTARGRGADALEVAGFQNAQKLCLQVERDIGNFVQK